MTGDVNQPVPKFYPNNFSVGDYLKAKKLIEKEKQEIEADLRAQAKYQHIDMLS